VNNKKYSNRQEKYVAKKIKGKKQPNSGATAFQKGDVRNDLFLLECKTATTEKQAMTIKKEWLTKLKEEAFAMRRPFFSLAFNFGGLGNQENYYVIDEKLFLRLINYLEETE
jgi:hypothetical protein